MAGDTAGWDRLQFAFTISFHNLFPQLTMGLALSAGMVHTGDAGRARLQRLRVLAQWAKVRVHEGEAYVSSL